MDNKKITKLSSYSTANTLDNIRYAKRKRTIRRRLTLMIILGLSLIVLVSLPVLRNIQTAAKYEEQAIVLAKELEKAEEKKESLEYEVALLEDEEYLAKLARKELNLSKEDEILINLPEDEEETKQGETADEADETDEKEEE